MTESAEDIWQSTGLRNSKELELTFENILSNDNYIAIVIDPRYTELAKITLKMIGFRFTDEIIIVSESLSEKIKHNKNEHIKLALYHFKINSSSMSQVIFIDTDQKSIEIAIAAGAKGILVPKDKTLGIDYLTQINNIVINGKNPAPSPLIINNFEENKLLEKETENVQLINHKESKVTGDFNEYNEQ